MKTFVWRLPQLMEERGWKETSSLRPHLALHGVQLSREQIFRLVKRPPERLSMETLMALCAIFDCTPSDLIVGSEDNMAESTRSKRSKKKAQPPIPVTRVQLL